MLVLREKRARDSQKSKVYRAENEAFRGWYTGKKFPEVADVEKFVAKIWKMKRFQKAFPMAAALPPPEVKDGGGARRARGGFHSIVMPRWSRVDWIILHELVHCIHQRQGGGYLEASHGWQYCEIYLRLVRMILGVAAHDKLKAQFKLRKVKYTKPRAKRVLTEEQKQALRDRLKLARLCKTMREVTNGLNAFAAAAKEAT